MIRSPEEISPESSVSGQIAENAVERVLIRTRTALEEPLGFEDFPPSAANFENSVDHDPPQILNLDEVTRQHIRTVLNMKNGKVQGKEGAAALLGGNPSTLRNRMRKLKIYFGRQIKS